MIVPIATDQMHRAISRVAARADAVTQADRLGRYLVGAPTVHGDLNGTQIDLVWDTEPSLVLDEQDD